MYRSSYLCAWGYIVDCEVLTESRILLVENLISIPKHWASLRNSLLNFCSPDTIGPSQHTLYSHIHNTFTSKQIKSNQITFMPDRETYDDDDDDEGNTYTLQRFAWACVLQMIMMMMNKVKRERDWKNNWDLVCFDLFSSIHSSVARMKPTRPPRDVYLYATDKIMLRS